jgi:hypothetical protein
LYRTETITVWVGRNPRRVGQKSCTWVIGMQQRIRRARITEGSQEEEERLRVDEYLERA